MSTKPQQEPQFEHLLQVWRQTK